MELCNISIDVYRREVERLCNIYIGRVDGILKDADSGNISVSAERAAVITSHINGIVAELDGQGSLSDELLRRADAIERLTKNESSCEACEGGEDKEYLLCVKAILYRDKPIYEVTIDPELLKSIQSAEPFELDTMVGALRSPRQFGVSLKRRFYHIPASQIEEHAIPRYIALYQSERIFGLETAGVKYYGEVKKCTPLKRSKIREIPKKSNELYYKFTVKEWKRLENPILPKELGFVRLFTNSFLLTVSKEVPELTLTAPNDFVFYRLLREAIDAVKSDEERVFAFFPLGELDFVVTASSIYLCKSGALQSSFWVADFLRTPTLIFDDIKRALARALKPL